MWPRSSQSTITHNAYRPIGEPGTIRTQSRIKPFFKFESERLSPVLASFEIVDNSTGKTVSLSGFHGGVWVTSGAIDQIGVRS
jgi:hypothetical protein